MKYFAEDFRRKIRRNWTWNTISAIVVVGILALATSIALGVVFEIVRLSGSHERLFRLVVYGLLVVTVLITWMIRGVRKSSIEYNFSEMSHTGKVRIHALLGEVIDYENRQLDLPSVPLSDTRGKE